VCVSGNCAAAPAFTFVITGDRIGYCTKGNCRTKTITKPGAVSALISSGLLFNPTSSALLRQET
jgi:hypothetical protein